MKKYLLHIVFCLMFINSYSQEKIESISIDDTKIEQLKFDQEELENYKKSNDFNYNVIENEPNIFERIWDWLTRIVKKILRWIFDDIDPAVGFLLSFLKVLPYIVLGILLFVILKFFLKTNTSNTNENDANINSVFTSDEEELINNKNLEELIKNSIEEKNYRLAIRYYYLFVLKKLSDKDLIIWQQEKTNEDYVREISKDNLKQDFTKTTRLYDFVWYGNFDIDETEFQKAEQLFSSFTKKIIG